jgi:hypothetical protein
MRRSNWETRVILAMPVGLTSFAKLALLCLFGLHFFSFFADTGFSSCLGRLDFDFVTFFKTIVSGGDAVIFNWLLCQFLNFVNLDFFRKRHSHKGFVSAHDFSIGFFVVVFL